MAKYVSKFLTVRLTNGESKQLRFRGKTTEEANAKLKTAKAQYDAGTLIMDSQTTFERWTEDWLETCKKSDVGTSHYDHLACMIKKHFYSVIGGLKMEEIRLTNVKRCLNSMEGLSKDYINKGYNTLREIFREAMANDLITKDPTIGLKRPKSAEKVDRRALTDEERKQLKEAISRHDRGSFFGMMLACGLRPGEVRALSWTNVDLKNKRLTVKHAIEDGTKNIKAPKSKAGERTIPIPDWYMPIIGGIKRTDSLLVFPDANGEVINKEACRRSWHSFAREIDIMNGAKLHRNKIIVHAFAQDLTPYNLRHTYCTELAEKGVDLRTAQYLMGHSDIKMTANIYSHVTSRMYENAEKLINM